MRRLSPYDQYEQREHPEWNLPPGVTPDDPELVGGAWPPPGARCGGCAHATRCKMLDGSDALVCTCDPEALVEVMRAQDACGDWEEA